VGDFLIPALFVVIGVANAGRAAWLRRRHVPVPVMVRVTGLFAFGAGAFLAALLIMCKP